MNGRRSFTWYASQATSPTFEPREPRRDGSSIGWRAISWRAISWRAISSQTISSQTSGWLVCAAAVAITFGFAGTPSSARADTPIPASPAEARAQAKKYFDQGALDYTQGNYEGAVVAWQRSYDLSREPLIFENIGNAYERLGKAKEARDALRKWRQVAPPEEHAILDRRIANLDTRIAREDAETLRKKQEDAAMQKKLGSNNGPGGNRDAPSAGPAFSVPGVVVGSVGVALVIAGVTVDGVAASKRPDKTTACKKSGASQLCLGSAKDDIQSSNTMAVAGDATWIIGAAAVAAGGVLLLTYRRPATERRAPPKTGRFEVLPVAGPGGGGLSICGAW